jgi:hypothetical protein
LNKDAENKDADMTSPPLRSPPGAASVTGACWDANGGLYMR